MSWLTARPAGLKSYPVGTFSVPGHLRLIEELCCPGLVYVLEFGVDFILPGVTQTK